MYDLFLIIFNVLHWWDIGYSWAAKELGYWRRRWSFEEGCCRVGLLVACWWLIGGLLDGV
jgi:hypothetical protein